AFLSDSAAGRTVAQRMESAMELLMAHRCDRKYGLLWGATTADWGDVRPEHSWGVSLPDSTHHAIALSGNAMVVVPLDSLVALLPDTRQKWSAIRDEIAERCITHLWDNEREKFIPHIDLDGSPFPEGFDEMEVYYHGGTAVAIEAGLLTKAQVAHAL